MNRPTTSSSPAPCDLAQIYRPIAEELSATTDALKEALLCGDDRLDGYLDYTFKLGGKRMRPALLLLSAQSWGGVEFRCRLCAAAIEMIHTGSLVHDDILDGASFRRKLETVNLKWDSHRAVLIGDLLITRAFDLICRCDDSVVFRKVAQFCEATVAGELFQTDSIGNFELTKEDYRRIVGGKTASLIEGSAFLGAYLSGARDEALDLYAHYGRSLGIAFQIVDDALDLVGNEAEIGKTLGSDLANQKETLPLILYFQSASRKDAESMLTLARGDASSRAEATRILRESGAIQGAYDEANAIVSEALDDLTKLRALAKKSGASSDESAFDSLEALAKFVVARTK